MKERSSRRAVLGALAAAGFLPLLAPGILARAINFFSDADDGIAERVLQSLQSRARSRAATGPLVVAAAREFLGAPYRARTLEQEGPERLVMNLREFDCMTLVESALALARCADGGKTGAADVRQELTLIRYRDGVINGYASRLHYFSDWVDNNQMKGIVSDETAALGGSPQRIRYGFLSSHRQDHPRLEDSTAALAIRHREEQLSTSPRMVISQSAVSGVVPHLKEGDIIGITSAIPGLDVIHTGIVAFTEGTPRLLHAPLSGGAVMLSAEPLAAALRTRFGKAGLIVARPLPP